MTTDTHRQTDIVDLLVEDHRMLQLMFDRFDESLDSRQREGLFRELTTALVQHEVAEELTVYPVLRRLGETGEAESEARIDEQAAVEKVLRYMEQIDVMGAEFTTHFRLLTTMVLRHALQEESVAFPYLTGATTPEERADMARRYERAVPAAPTHPHPNAPDTSPGNRVVGPVVALADRVRDAFRNPDDAD